jgi:hypothetical protein
MDLVKQPEPLNVFTTGVVTALTQSFLTARYWLLYVFLSLRRGPLLTRSRTKNKCITLILFFFIAVAVSFSSFSTINSDLNYH